MLLFIFILCKASFKGRDKNVELISGITEITQFLFCGSYVHMYFVLTRTVATIYKANSTDTFITL